MLSKERRKQDLTLKLRRELARVPARMCQNTTDQNVTK